jgi:hypothetical protein
MPAITSVPFWELKLPLYRMQKAIFWLNRRRDGTVGQKSTESSQNAA